MSAADFLLNHGTGQNLAPTTAILTETVTFGTPAYRLTVVNVNDTVQNDGPSLFESIVGMPASFRYLVASFWSPVDFTDPSVHWAAVSSTGSLLVGTTWGISIENQNLISFQNYLPDNTPTPLVAWTITAAPQSVNHFLISIDSVAQTYQCYVNGHACPIFVAGANVPGNMTNVSDPINVFQIAGSLNTGSVPINVPITEFWLGDTASFFDLTNPANVAKFYGGAETPVYLGINGEIPTGSAPPLYFTDRLLGAPARLNMDNVVVTSLTTESPCTVAQYTTPPPVVNAVGLRWSDTRGQTFGNAVPQALDTNPLSQLQWNRTGYARDRVFELFWSAAVKTALNGAFVIVDPWKS